LRLELAPFGVDVLEIVTGAVRSKGQTYFGNLKPPTGSLYKDIEDIIVSRAQGKNEGTVRMDTKTYTSAVFEEIMKRGTGRFWYGTNADVIKMSTTAAAVPQSAMVCRRYPSVHLGMY
jgi:1-acylglycerone phosphate reductase